MIVVQVAYSQHRLSCPSGSHCVTDLRRTDQDTDWRHGS